MICYSDSKKLFLLRGRCSCLQQGLSGTVLALHKDVFCAWILPLGASQIFELVFLKWRKPPTFLRPSGSSLTDANWVAPAGGEVTRIHRQKETETSIWARPLPGPGRLSLLSVWERAPRVSEFSCLRLPFSQGKEFVSEKFQFQTLKLSCLTPRSSVPCIGAHPITVRTLLHPHKRPWVYL